MRGRGKKLNTHLALTRGVPLVCARDEATITLGSTRASPGIAKWSSLVVVSLPKLHIVKRGDDITTGIHYPNYLNETV